MVSLAIGMMELLPSEEQRETFRPPTKHLMLRSARMARLEAWASGKNLLSILRDAAPGAAPQDEEHCYSPKLANG